MSIRGPRKEVMRFRLDDRRYDTLEAEYETDLAVVCKPGEEGFSRKIWKHGPGWTSGKNTRFLSVEGKPVSVYLSDNEYKAAAVEDFLRLAWDDETVDKIPRAQLDKLTDRVWDATVTVQPAKLEPDVDISQLEADDWLFEADLFAFDNFGKSTPKVDKRAELIRRLVDIALGALLSYWVINSGVWVGFTGG